MMDVNAKVNGKHHPKGGQEDRTQTSCKETERGETHTHLDQSTEAMETWEAYHQNITESVQDEMQKVDMCGERFQVEEKMRELRAQEW